MARSMRPERRAAMAKGRAEDRAVRDYLTALHTKRRASKRKIESVCAQLDRVHGQLHGASPIEELLLLQQHRDLESELRSMGGRTDIEVLEAAFVSIAASYSRARGIAYTTWRELGVDAAVLKSAGIPRSSPS